jgi:hypothetical protein
MERKIHLHTKSQSASSTSTRRRRNKRHACKVKASPAGSRRLRRMKLSGTAHQRQYFKNSRRLLNKKTTTAFNEAVLTCHGPLRIELQCDALTTWDQTKQKRVIETARFRPHIRTTKARRVCDVCSVASTKTQLVNCDEGKPLLCAGCRLLGLPRCSYTLNFPIRCRSLDTHTKCRSFGCTTHRLVTLPWRSNLLRVRSTRRIANPLCL